MEVYLRVLTKKRNSIKILAKLGELMGYQESLLNISDRWDEVITSIRAKGEDFFPYATPVVIVETKTIIRLTTGRIWYQPNQKLLYVIGERCGQTGIPDDFYPGFKQKFPDVYLRFTCIESIAKFSKTIPKGPELENDFMRILPLWKNYENYVPPPYIPSTKKLNSVFI